MPLETRIDQAYSRRRPSKLHWPVSAPIRIAPSGTRRLRSASLVAVAAALAGCSSFNPYQKSLLLQADLARVGQASTMLRSKAVAPEQGVATDAHDRWAGDLATAQAAVNAQREEWFESLTAQSRVRAGSSLGLIGLSSLALYSGLNAAAGSTVQKRLALTGAAASGTYAASSWWVNPAQEQAYIKGYRLLTCQLALSIPLQTSAAELGEPGGAFGLQGDIRQLEASVNALDRLLLDEKATKAPTALNRGAAAEADDIRRAQTAFDLGRKTLLNARRLVSEIEQSGALLRRRSELIVASISREIHAASRDLPSPEGLVSGSLKKSMASFMAIQGGDEDEVKGEKEESETGGGAETSKPTKASPASGEVAKRAAALIQGFSGASSDISPNKLDAQPAQRLQLSAAIASLYAARRPIADRLTIFSSARDAWVSHPACAASESLLALSPPGPIEIEPGKTAVVLVLNSAGLPQTTLQGGPASSELVVKPDGQVSIRVMADAKASSGFTLTVKDDKGGMEVVEFKLKATKAKNQGGQ